MLRFSSKSLLLVVVLGAAVLALGLLPQDSAKACTGPNCPTKPTRAEVGTTGNPPVIECKWELPDMDSSLGGIQYTSPVHVHDDDMSVAPDASPAPGTQVPCDLDPATEDPPTMPNNVHNMIQVKPNLENLPEEQRIQLWAAVDSDIGIDQIVSVYWDVYHPDGSFKVQVHGWGPNSDPLTSGRVAQTEWNCDSFGSGAGADGTMFEAAVHTGQMTAAAVDDANRGMIAKCQEQEKALYYAEFPLSKDQMCGEYKIVLTVNSTGGTDTMTNYIDVPCIFGLQCDFNAVDWGYISPGGQDLVSGDLLWDPPNDEQPTIKNVGNDGMGLSLTFSKMIGPLKGEIISFDAAFGRSAGTLEYIDPIAAEAPAEFGYLPAQVLCANEVGKLDLSIHPPSPLIPDIYTGTLSLLGVARLNECKGNVHID